MLKEKTLNKITSTINYESYMPPISESLTRDLDEAWEEMQKPKAKWLSLEDVISNFKSLKLKNVRS